ncbi:tape measure protein [Rosenbergiella collisarenosi]|uniref:tape measure protein n=1 Tax=Rosenbergiella collisarenosi TaxID=1544695 RepID=UPI001F4D39E3|nr:tape measure protein [Rosenbergiella collisarenosi]
MASTNAGSIYYDVEMDVKGLLSAQQQVNARLDSMERGFNSASKAVEGTERSFSSLTKISVALSAAMSVKQITEYATAWVDVNNKLANAVKTNESLAEVTSRVFDIAQSTKSDLQSTAALYGTLERSTRSLGLSSNDLSSVIKTVNEGLVLSGATTQEAAGATLQLSQALASGALRGDEFNSVSENGSRLAQALADSLGVNIGQLKVMAGQGKLTSDVVINGLLSQGATIAQEFNNHTTTLAQSLQIAGNNLTKFFGENTTVNTFLNAAGSGIVTLSEHISGLSLGVSALAVVMGSRYVASLTMAASAAIKSTLATIEQSKASASAAQTAVLRAQLEERSAIALRDSSFREVALATAQVQSAVTANEAAAAQARLSSARMVAVDAAVAAKSATNALTVAQEASSVASLASTNAIYALGKGALGLIGGPVGFATLAATALFMWHENAVQAKKSANELADSVGNLVVQFKSMSDVQLGSEIAKLSQNIPSLTSQVDDMQEAYNNATYRVQDLQKEISNFGTNTTRGRQAAEAMQGALDNQAIAAENLDKAQGRLSQTQSAVNIGHAQLNGTMQQGLDLLSRENTQVGVADGLYRKFGQTLNIAAQAKQNFNSQSLNMQRSPDAEGYLKQLNDENDLLAIQDLRQRAIAKGRLDFQNKIASNKQEDPNYLNSTKYKADIQLAGELAGKYYDEQQADSARQKQQKSGITTANQQAKAEESVTQKLDQLRQQSDLNAISTQNLTLEQAKLRAEMSLGKNATAAQREEAAKYAEVIWQQAAALKARNLIPEVAENDDYQSKTAQLELLKGQKDSQGNLIISQQQYQQESEKLAAEHAGNLAKIGSQKAVTPQKSLAGQVDPVQQLTNQHQEQLQLINQYEQAGVLSHDRAIALKKAADSKYQTDLTNAQWAIFTQQSVGYQALGAAVDGFGQSASSAISGVLTGTESMQSALQNISNTVLNDVINTFVQMGLEWVKAAVMGGAKQEAMIAGTTAAQVGGIATQTAASTTAAATTTAAWTPAAIMSSIASWGGAVAIGLGAMVGIMALSGKRKNGGSVQGGGMYEVGESNLPEMLTMGGKSYMIPGNNGRVFSNNDLTGSGPSIPKVSTGSEYLKSASSQSSDSAASQSKNIQVNVQFIDQTSGGQHSFDAQASQQGDVVTVTGFLIDLDRGGPMTNGMINRFGLNMRASGDY